MCPWQTLKWWQALSFMRHSWLQRNHDERWSTSQPIWCLLGVLSRRKTNPASLQLNKKKKKTLSCHKLGEQTNRVDFGCFRDTGTTCDLKGKILFKQMEYFWKMLKSLQSTESRGLKDLQQSSYHSLLTNGKERQKYFTFCIYFWSQSNSIKHLCSWGSINFILRAPLGFGKKKVKLSSLRLFPLFCS